jgi:SAM-dependent methyltransferase
MNLLGFLCYNLAVAFSGPLRKFGSRTPTVTRFDSNEKYFEQRVADTSHYQKLFAPYASFANKTVLDLGCNRGYLLASFLQRKNFNAIGAELVSYYLKDARRDYGDKIQFVQSTPTAIPLQDNSVDVVYTIDTVEHLSRPKDIFNDVFRILKPGGVFLVHFNPWLNPHGSHLDDVIPFPWSHVFFSMNTLLDVAERLYDSPHYDTACYYLDTEGNKKPVQGSRRMGQVFKFYDDQALQRSTRGTAVYGHLSGKDRLRREHLQVKPHCSGPGASPAAR